MGFKGVKIIQVCFRDGTNVTVVLGTIATNTADNILKYFPQQIGFNVSSNLSSKKETSCVNFFFSCGNIKNISSTDFVHKVLKVYITFIYCIV